MSATHGDPSRTLHLARRFRAPPEKVFRAWTDPQALKQWWGPDGFTTPFVAIDLRVGGTYHIEMHAPDGRIQQLRGTYVDIQPPNRLVMTWYWQGTERDDGYESLVTVEFQAHGNETEIALTHERLPETSMGDYNGGWTSTLDRLESFLPLD